MDHFNSQVFLTITWLKMNLLHQWLEVACTEVAVPVQRQTAPLEHSAVKQLFPVLPVYCPNFGLTAHTATGVLSQVHYPLTEAHSLLLMPLVEITIVAHLCLGSMSGQSVSVRGNHARVVPVSTDWEGILGRALSTLSILTTFWEELLAFGQEEG